MIIGFFTIAIKSSLSPVGYKPSHKVMVRRA
jgi:hypothetical protein